MGKQLYFECMSGISGDMTVAALLDLGADETVLREAISSIPVSGFDIAIKRVKKAGVDACDFDVILDKEHENHDHDMEYLHGMGQGKEKEHHHGDHEHAHHSEEHTHGDHEHTHGNEKHTQDGETHTHDSEEHTHEGHHHGHSHHGHSHHDHHHHEHRGLHEINAIIEQCNMTKRAKLLAKRIFDIVAQAESKAHGVPKEEVHFHEVGAVDSIVDIISVAVCFDNLGIEEVIVPVLYEGSGSVRCQHGILPVPVPATANIVCDYKLKLHKMDFMGEFVTPTGAAIVAALKTANRLPNTYCIEKIGIGAGKREYEKASLLRIFLIDTEEKKDVVWKLETNVDDCTGENLGFVMEQLLQAGARDVNYTPVYMKKNRPAYEIHVLCDEKDIAKMEQILFEDTTTIGIRKVEMERSVLERQIKTIYSEYGTFRVKECKVGQNVRVYLEYEDVAALARRHNIPYPDLHAMLQREARKHI